MASTSDFPTPKHIKGGCLCGALRYEVDFPPDHDFKHSASTCECTQCRKQTGGLFLVSHRVRPASAFRFTTDTATLKRFSASASAERGFCSDCGSLIYWQPQSGGYTCFTVGTVDPLYLFGEGADAVQAGESHQPIPTHGFGLALASGEGSHYWSVNEIPGVTDNVPVAGFGRGTRYPKDD
ncbi:glutathione-dependent formaldehyde-activating GFA [Lasiosphaeris hirsuta]|uniref:Glutathione-dependent formaldehyde-activating GFA n=1 Tax=Lasiosphaeris hirsuta TaxID=260670 RepID=A0AA40AFX2_9PEZI|nr:glutathione-dependent formaldehyde-activating GFA [Lasiosphaeris hirsuta]